MAKRIIDLDAGSVNQHSWFEQADTENNKSEKVSADDISDYVGMRANYSSLSTTAKGLVGSINEVAGKKLSATLTAGSTSLTFTDSSITADSLISVYTEGGLLWNSITTAVGSVVLTFDAQATDVDVAIIVR